MDVWLVSISNCSSFVNPLSLENVHGTPWTLDMEAQPQIQCIYSIITYHKYINRKENKRDSLQ